MVDTQDVPDKSGRTEEMHKIEEVKNIMEFEERVREVEEIEKEPTHREEEGRTIATNTTR